MIKNNGGLIPPTKEIKLKSMRIDGNALTIISNNFQGHDIRSGKK